MKELEKEILKKTKLEIQKKFKPTLRGKVSETMVKAAVHKVMAGYTSADVELARKFPHIFCEKCGECCRVSDPIIVDIEDLVRISEFLGVTLDVVIANYTKTLKTGQLSLRTNPCPFLSNNECSIYPARPMNCRLFPLQIEGNKVVPVIFVYCGFIKKLIVRKAVTLISIELMKLLKPEMYKRLEEQIAQMQSQMLDSQKKQIARS